MSFQLPYPFDPALMLRRKRALCRELAAQPNLLDKRIAILGGSTTEEVADQLTLFLLARGIRPTIYQSAYGQYVQEALFPPDALRAFRPDLVYVHTTVRNLAVLPTPDMDAASVTALHDDTLAQYRAVWDSLAREFACPVVQNNFELPLLRPLGNLDGSHPCGVSRFIARLNESLAQETAQRPSLLLHDIHYLSACLGLDRWASPRAWHLYKYALDPEAIPVLAHQLSAVMAAVWGLTHKCLVLDLDNTLWGGVIGDDGLDGIRIGPGSAEAEAHAALQEYARQLKARGILLAACSKNDEAIAREGFTHSGNVLGLSDFSAFVANWEPKPGNLGEIARSLGLGLDSLVFLDDHPAERAIVRAQVPDVAVPEAGEDVTEFARLLDRAALFETTGLSAEDLQRAGHYEANRQRLLGQAQFASQDAFLQSLEMQATLGAFCPRHLERIVQLINKTNQFNLTTRRCTRPEVEAMANDPAWLTRYACLADRFGDHGLVSVVAGRQDDDTLHLELWLMSCRVLHRGLEYALLQSVVAAARARGVQRLLGYYRPTARNGLVAGFYEHAGFTCVAQSPGETVWQHLLTDPDPPWHPLMEVTHVPD